jgi:hypothetical protein
MNVVRRSSLFYRAVLAVAITAAGACSTNQKPRSFVERDGACDRACLKEVADQYLDALSARDLSRLSFAPDVRFTENGRDLKLGDGLWRNAGALGSYRIHIIDSDANGVAVQTILLEGASQVQLLVRLKVKDRRISEVETLVARKGDTCCWDPERLNTLPPIYDQGAPAMDRETREEMIAAADAYFTALHTAGTSGYRRAIVERLMNRYENGKQTTNVVGGNRIIRWDAQSQLDSAMFGRISVVNRRYPVVDTQHETLLGIVVFEYPNSDRPSEIISELFKITGGTIVEIRAVMVKRPSTGWK